MENKYVDKCSFIIILFVFIKLFCYSFIIITSRALSIKLFIFGFIREFVLLSLVTRT